MRTIADHAKSLGLAMAGKNPWGGSGGGDEPSADSGSRPEDAGKEEPKGPKNPWLPGGDAPEPRRSAGIEDIFKGRGPEGPRRRGGGPRGPNLRLPERPGGKSWLPVIAGVIALGWLALTSIHQVGPKEQGLVSWLGGKYARTLSPGINFSFPWPVQSVSVEQVSEFRIIAIPESEPQLLMLTGDQNLVDLSYIVRWNIKDLRQFRYQLANPEQTVNQVAEAAMRASVAEQTLDKVISGAGRADIEGQVLARMQAILDGYRSGIAVQGVQIRKTDPPKEVEQAFKDVSAAQQDAESYINQAEAAAQQVLARAQGDAAAFDKVYEQYRLAPEVTRRRMYYETMERVLSNTDKTIIEAGGVMPYLPLPEIRRRTQLPGTTVTAPAAQER